MKTLQVGDKIAVDGSKSNNHGCTDWAILKWLGSGKAEVVAANSCTSCWQVGHSQDHVFAEVGEVWTVDPASVVEAETWATSINWELVK